MVFFEHHGLEEQESFRVISPKNRNFPFHFHRAFELIFVEEGELFLTIEQKEYRIQKQHGAFIFPHQLHGFKTSGQSRLRILIFSPELIGHFFTAYKGLIPVDPVFKISQLPARTFDSVYSQKSFLYGICDTLLHSTSFSPNEYSPKTKIVQRIVAFVDKYYFNAITLKDVAACLQYDYAYLSKIFQQMTQLSFTEYLNQYRISQACYQLKSSQKSVSEIAMDCGYQNIRTFNRNFQKLMHTTPMQYKIDYRP